MRPKYTQDLSDAFFEKLGRICHDLGCQTLDMLGVMKSESDVRANARNPTTNASGLIQFMPRTLSGLGYVHGHEQFRKLDAYQQLPWVERYFRPHKGKLRGAGRVYIAVFLPALLDKAASDDYVLCARGGPLGWAYEANTVFDQDGDKRITVAELELAVRRNCRGARWLEIVSRATQGQAPREPVTKAKYDLRTTLGIQQACDALGCYPGPQDGYPGPLTTAGLEQFQRKAGLPATGFPDPLTRAALSDALKKLESTPIA